MRLLGMTVAAAFLAASLSGCGKSAPSGTAAEAPPAPTLSAAEKTALQATYPEPFKTADLANGEAKFALCTSCHTIVPGGADMTGPNLNGVFGRKAATHGAYKYSDALKAANITWDAAKLDAWLTKPMEMVPGTKMSFAGLSDPKDRTDVIAYLMVEGGYKP